MSESPIAADAAPGAVPDATPCAVPEAGANAGVDAGHTRPPHNDVTFTSARGRQSPVPAHGTDPVIAPITTLGEAPLITPEAVPATRPLMAPATGGGMNHATGSTTGSETDSQAIAATHPTPDSDTADTDALVLAARLDTRAAHDLARDILARQGRALRIDAANVSYLGAVAAQVVIAARQMWQREGQPFDIARPSQALMDDLTRMGLATCIGHERGAQ